MATLQTVRLKESGVIISEQLVCESPVCGLGKPLTVVVRQPPIVVTDSISIKDTMVGCTDCQTLQCIALLDT